MIGALNQPSRARPDTHGFRVGMSIGEAIALGPVRSQLSSYPQGGNDSAAVCPLVFQHSPLAGKSAVAVFLVWVWIAYGGISQAAGRTSPVETTSLVVSAQTADVNGVQSFVVRSPFLGPETTVVRILEPTNPSPGMPCRLIFVLPVDTGMTSLSSQYSDGLEELRLLEVHNRYNATLIAPSFNVEPWYGDHDTDGGRRLESFIIKDLVPFSDALLKPGIIPQRWVVGFSKSGNGALSLILRNPTVFSAAAAWDAPTQFTDLSAFKGMQANFGSEKNFDRYEIPRLVATRASDFQSRNRIWLGGDKSAWTEHMLQLHQQMLQADVMHTWLARGRRPHSWNGGWLEDAVASLNANAQFHAPVPASLHRRVDRRSIDLSRPAHQAPACGSGSKSALSPLLATAAREASRFRTEQRSQAQSQRSTSRMPAGDTIFFRRRNGFNCGSSDTRRDRYLSGSQCDSDSSEQTVAGRSRKLHPEPTKDPASLLERLARKRPPQIAAALRIATTARWSFAEQASHYEQGGSPECAFVRAAGLTL
jgi:S-formylglutathione hydrolase FrmB